MSKGGYRSGAGRLPGSGKFGKATQAIWVPVSDIENIFRLIENKFYRLPLYQDAVSAGFPSPRINLLDGV